MVFSLLSALFVIACAIYLLLDLQLIRGLRKLSQKGGFASSEKPSVTVLIAARNEEHTLPRVLEALLTQDYPAEKFNVLVINDRSGDGTEAVLRTYSLQYPGRIGYLNIHKVQAGMSPKKHALMKGLEKAEGEWIAVTDADCVMESGWLSSLSQEFGQDVGMVLGLTAYVESRKGIGYGSQALEFASYGVVSAALVGLGFPVIANANNLAYRRSAFDETEGFRKHGHIVSGDDDFILQEIHATGRWAVRFCKSPEALMRTAPPDSWSHFWEQRKRWASKCGMYRPRQVLFLAGVFAFYASIPALLIPGLWNPRWIGLSLGGFFLKTLSDLVVMRRGLKLFGLSPLLRFFPVTAILHIPLILAAVVAGSQGVFTWKGQILSRRA